MGSSRISSSGRCMNAWMRPILRLLPLERSATLRSRSQSRRSASEATWLRVDAAAQVGEVEQRVAPGEVRIQTQLTGQVAAARLDRQGVAAAVQPEDERAAFRGPDEVQQHADGGRLAGPVGAEEAEDLARPDLEVEPDDAAALAVALGQLLGEDRRHAVLWWSAAHASRIRRSAGSRTCGLAAAAGPGLRGGSLLRDPRGGESGGKTRTGRAPVKQSARPVRFGRRQL